MTIHHVLLLLACLCFGCAAIGVPAKISLVALGLFLWSLTWFV